MVNFKARAACGVAMFLAAGLVQAASANQAAPQSQAASPVAAQPGAASGSLAAQIRAAQAHVAHVVIIMQENRSFDTYFGTYPGADGIPANVCMPLLPANPAAGCVKPFHNPLGIENGGPHLDTAMLADLDDGVTHAKIDGFVASETGFDPVCHDSTTYCFQKIIGRAHHDAMGYHDQREIPNYWAYAKNFVLLDHMFEGARGYSWPSHVEMTSGWTALCTNPAVALSCTTNTELSKDPTTEILPWVNVFQLLELNGVSWKYYVDGGEEPDCDDPSGQCAAIPQAAAIPSLFNPVGNYAWVQAQGSAYLASHNPDTAQFYSDIANGTLPQVSWLIPNATESEHPPEQVSTGMAYVTRLVNAVMNSPYWNNTVIFIAWDDFGGYYDHVVPPNIDRVVTGANPVAGFGLRVPALVLGAYARQGRIDHAVMSFGNFNRFIEDIFMSSARIDPVAMGNPDNRPDLRDALTKASFLDGTTQPVGNLLEDFDFTQAPRPPLVLSSAIPNSLLPSCGANASTLLCSSAQVALSWLPANPAQGTAPITYHVVRDTPAVKVCETTLLKCTDTPGAGTHVYRIYQTDATGAAGPLSAGVEADEP